MTHVIWDWNGTLLDDTEACVKALNLMLARRGQPTVTRDYFRHNFTFPARDFYAKVGLKIDEAEWDGITKEFHADYAAQAIRLNDEALAALDYVESMGARQSVLSALRQDKLEAQLAHFGLHSRFDFVYGSDNLNGASKLDRAIELKAALPEAELIMIGDALHDYEVASAIGAKSVLHSQGSHDYERLAEVAPTGHTLLEALRLAFGCH